MLVVNILANEKNGYDKVFRNLIEYILISK